MDLELGESLAERLGNAPRPENFGGVVTGRHQRHPELTGELPRPLGELARYEKVAAVGRRVLEEVGGRARAEPNGFDPLGSPRERRRAALRRRARRHLGDGLVATEGRRPPPAEAESVAANVAEVAAHRGQLKGVGEPRVVSELGMMIERQVIGEE